MAQDLTDLKKHVFFELLDLAGRVFVLVGHSDNVLIGERGFLPEEKEKGLVLVFNRKMNFEWNAQGISATLGFGQRTKNVLSPLKTLFRFSPLTLTPSFQSPLPRRIRSKQTGREKGASAFKKEKVIKVDFGKKS